MRKIIVVKELDPKTFLPSIIIKQKNDDGSVNELYSAIMKWQPEPKYTKEQLEKINSINTVLAEKGMDLLSEEEIEYMLDPEGFEKRLTDLEKRNEGS